MPNESSPALAPALVLLMALAGCAAAPAAPEAPPMRALVLPHPPAPEAAAAPAPPPVATPARATQASVPPADAVLAYADRLRALPAAEVAQEIQRLGETSFTPVRAMQLALALGQSRNGANAARAQSLLQRLLAQQDAEALALHPLARLLAAQLAEQRRADENAERQAQQLREAQRRIDQLNDRLEAVRAIERSLPTRPRGEPAAPAPRAATPRQPAH